MNLLSLLWLSSDQGASSLPQVQVNPLASVHGRSDPVLGGGVGRGDESQTS